MLATDLAQIVGTVVTDLDNGPNADVAAVSQTVELFRNDGTNAAVLDAGDTLVGLPTTTDANGRYEFSGVTEGDYFVRVRPSTGFRGLSDATPDAVVSSLITVSALEAMGSTNITIDNFVADLALPDATLGSPQSDTVDAGTIAGGELDLFAQVTAGAGDLGVESGFSNSAARTVLSFESGSGINGRVVATYDGNDGDADTLAQGLGQNLLDGGNNTGFAVNIAVNEAVGTLIVRAYSSATDFSTATIELNNVDGGVNDGTNDDVDSDGIINGLGPEGLTIDFADFIADPAGGVDFSSVTALELEIDFTETDPDNDPLTADGENGLDGEIEVLGVVGVTEIPVDPLTVFPEMSIGDLVFLDLNDNGMVDAGDTGVSGVALTLLTGAGGATGLTTSTGVNGAYEFTGLLPGDYLVRVDASNFTGVGALVDRVTSSGNDATPGVAPDPDLTANDKDKGTAQNDGSVLSAAVTLVGLTEIEDVNDDGDNNRNSTLDFGFFGYDLTITKDVDLSTAAPGDTLQYTMVVTNDGPGTATGVTFADVLPTGVTFVSGTSTVIGQAVNGTPGNANVSSTIGTLASGATATIRITATVDANAATGVALVNTATVTGVGETGPTPNTASDTTTISPRIDLAITKSDDDNDQALMPGDTVVYTLRVQNNGPSGATNVVVTDTLPSGLTFNSLGSTPAPASTADGLNDTTVLTYNLGSLASTANGGTEQTITISAIVDAGVTGLLINNASVAANEIETNTLNNAATAQSTVNAPQVDVQITKLDNDNDQPVSANDTVIYTLTVQNNGPSDATGVVVTDTLPNGLTYVSNGSTPAPASVVLEANGTTTLTYNVGDLTSLTNNGQPQTITIQATVDAGVTTTLVNLASVTANEAETDLTNNSATAQSTPALGSISGTVYVDRDGDNNQEAGDAPIAGVLLTLLNANGQQVATATTDANGRYSFTNLAPGVYRVVETQPDAPFFNLDQTSGTAGADPSGLNQIANITVVANEDSEANDFTEGLTLSKRQWFWTSGGFN